MTDAVDRSAWFKHTNMYGWLSPSGTMHRNRTWEHHEDRAWKIIDARYLKMWEKIAAQEQYETPDAQDMLMAMGWARIDGRSVWTYKGTTQEQEEFFERRYLNPDRHTAIPDSVWWEKSIAHALKVMAEVGWFDATVS